MNPIFIEVNGHYINISTIRLYRKEEFDPKGVEVFFCGSEDYRRFTIDINEFKAKIDEALAKKN